MKYSLLLLPFLASVASAQEDVWKSLGKGDRVQITFRSGNMLLGNLAAKPGDPRLTPVPVDYSTANEITLDLSLEYPGLNGTMTVSKKEIKEIRESSKNLDPATMKRIQDEMARIQKQAAADDNERRSREAERDKEKAKAREQAVKEGAEKDKDKEKGAALLKEFEDIQKGKELLRRFPPEKYGPNTLKEAVEMGIRRQPVPVDMREFADPEVQRLWNIALKAQKDEQKEKEKSEEKK